MSEEIWEEALYRQVVLADMGFSVLCKRCGAVVIDRKLHDEFHRTSSLEYLRANLLEIR